MQRNWPMVGREAELGAVLEQVTRPSVGSVVLAGRAGVGKTRVAAAALEEAARRGCAVERIVGTHAAAAIPLGAVGALVPGYEPGGAGLAETMAGIRAALLAAADGRPLVVGVDDAHSLDDASAAVVHQLVVGGLASAVVTVRSGEAAPDAVTALWKDGWAERIELQPLAEGQMREVLEGMLGGPADEPTADELVRACGGNCLYLRELVRAAHHDGSLVVDRGLWRLRRPARPGPRLVDLVEDLVRDLPEATRDLLELVAVGDPLPLRVVEALVDPAALHDATRRELIDVSLTGRRSVVRLGHPLYGEVLRARLPWLRLRDLCRTLAESQEALGLRRRDDALRLVTWKLDAGMPAQPDRLLAASDLVLARGDLRAAERFAAAAAAALDRDAPGRFAACLALGFVRCRLGDLEGAVAALDETTPATDAERVDDADLRASVVFLHGRAADAEALLEAAAAGLTDPAARARLVLSRSRLIAGRGHPQGALAALDEGDIAPGDPLEPSALNVRGPALAFLGRFDDADEVVRRSADPSVAPSRQVRIDLAWRDATLMLTATGRGRLAEAESLARILLDQGLALRHRAVRRAGAGATGWFLFQQGALAPAVTLLIEGVDEYGGIETNGMRTLAWTGLAGSYALMGDLDRAEETLARMDGDENQMPIRWFDPLTAVARAFVAAGRGLPSEARRVLEAALAEADEAGLRLVEVYVAAAAARAGAPDLAVTSLRRLVDTVDGPLPAILLAHAEAMAGRDARRLERAADGLEATGMVLSAVEALAVAARRHDDAGRSRAALAARARTRRLAERCPGANLTALDPATASSLLTPREREIAQLAATGVSSPDIAARLFLSVRTVDNHLGRVYLKLGVKGRAELPGAVE